VSLQKMAGNTPFFASPSIRGLEVSVPPEQKQLIAQEILGLYARSETVPSMVGDRTQNLRWNDMTGNRTFSDPQALQILNDGLLIADNRVPNRRENSALTDLRAEIKQNVHEMTESRVPLGNKLVGVAQELGRDPEKWRSSTTGKCNQFVGEVIEACTGAKPWDGPTPTCHGINDALSKSVDWKSVWSSQGKTSQQALQGFEEYKPHQGEVVIWDNSDVQHSGVLDEDRCLYYAGSRNHLTGYAKTDIKFYTGTPEHPKNFGAPTVIYRHVNADQLTK
jgi:hypothetical protein